MVAPAQRKPGIFGIRDVNDLTTETEEAGHQLKRSVSALQLTAMGVGAIIGTGIFVVIGKGAGIAVAAVAVGWGGNVNAFLKAAFGVQLPTAISKSPSDGGVFNVPAVLIVVAIT